MRVPWFLLLILFSSALCASSVQPQETDQDFTVRILLGLKDTAPARWDGTVRVEGGSVTEVWGYRFEGDDTVIGNTGWRIETRRTSVFRPIVSPGKEKQLPPSIDVPESARPMIPNGVYMTVRETPSCRVYVETAVGAFDFRPAQVQFGKPEILLNEQVQIERLPTPTRLGDGYTEDDFPAVATGKDGTVWAAWIAYSETQDEIRLQKWDGSRWGGYTTVPGALGKLWRPRLLATPDGALWCFWAQQENGNWDIFARCLREERWGSLMQLSSSPSPERDVAAACDPRGDIFVVWQRFSPPDADIVGRWWDGKRWSDPIDVTQGGGNDWSPDVAVDGSGAHVVWDSYKKGTYDVFYRTVGKDGSLGEIVEVAGTPKFEANPTVALDQMGRAWIAWEEGDVNWGKDTGFTKPASPGRPLGAWKKIGSACVEGETVKSLAQDPSKIVEDSNKWYFQTPQFLVDTSGGLWLRVRGTEVKPRIRAIAEPAWRKDRAAAYAPGPSTAELYWEEWVTRWDKDHWTPPVSFPRSAGRQGALADAAFDPSGRLWVTWPTDARVYQSPRTPIQHQVHVASLEGMAGDGMPPLVSSVEAVGQPAVVHRDEPGDIRTIRSYRTWLNGAELRIARGDLHRHTEFSWDMSPNDGTAMHFYRYMVDAAGMDFGAMTDHSADGAFTYSWWYTQKAAEQFHAPGLFVPLFGYERTIQYPYGHRNVIHAVPDVPMERIHTKTDMRRARPISNSTSLDTMENDTELLYEALRKTGGICIPHTSATVQGTDWHTQQDPSVEPVVEIFQGLRNSYEHEGAPLSTAEYPGVIDPEQKAGYVWNAWRRGFRIGTIASSDHQSTHMSYAMVYTPELSREAIFEGIKKRHTYGATDNIVLACRMGDHFMGDEFAATTSPKLEVEVIGTDDLAQIDVIKNNTFVYQLKPETQSAKFSFEDRDIKPGTSYYYVRVQQKDEQLAWGSPIWVNFQ